MMKSKNHGGEVISSGPPGNFNIQSFVPDYKDLEINLKLLQLTGLVRRR
jgi:hypothetical protein